jgi:hypothetical protein
MKQRWSEMRRQFKRVSITKYLKVHFGEGDRSRPSVINDIKEGRLIGELLGGKWYVFVDEDQNPIYSLEEHSMRAMTPPSTGNKIADAILARRKP